MQVHLGERMKAFGDIAAMERLLNEKANLLLKTTHSKLSAADAKPKHAHHTDDRLANT